MDEVIDLAEQAINLMSRFSPGDDFLEWLNYFEYVGNYLDIKEEIEANFLLLMIDPSVYDNLVFILRPYHPLEFSYKELILVLENIYSPFQGEAAAEYRFMIRNQINNESVAHYASALTLIINECSREFYTTETLINRFINGIKWEEARNRLLKEQNLTFYDVVLIAQEIELDSLGICHCHQSRNPNYSEMTT